MGGVWEKQEAGRKAVGRGGPRGQMSSVSRSLHFSYLVLFSPGELQNGFISWVFLSRGATYKPGPSGPTGAAESDSEQNRILGWFPCALKFNKCSSRGSGFQFTRFILFWRTGHAC